MLEEEKDKISNSHDLWLGEFPELTPERVEEIETQIVTALSASLIPEVAFFYDAPRAYVVPSENAKAARLSLKNYQSTNGERHHLPKTPIFESEFEERAFYYAPGQVNLFIALAAANYTGGVAALAERLEDIIIATLLNYDVYGDHAMDLDGGGAGVVTRRNKRLCNLTVHEINEIYTVHVLINLNNDVTGFEALPGEEEFVTVEEESLSMIDIPTFKGELGDDLATSLGKRTQRLDLFGLGNALLKVKGDMAV